MMHRRRRRGTNLLEVMIALVTMVIMLFMALQATSNALELRDLLEQRDATTRSARVALGKIRRDVQLAFLTSHRDAINQYETVFVGRDDNPDTLWFATLSHQRLYRDARESDQTEITLWAEPAPGDGRGYVLYHREAPRIDEEPSEGGTVMPLAHDVRSFEVRYLDSQADEWRSEWDTRSADTPNRLPRAVQVGLVLIGQDPEDPDRTVDLPFLTTILLEYAPSYSSRSGVVGGIGTVGQPGNNPPLGTGTRPGRSGRSGRGAASRSDVPLPGRLR